MKGRGRVVFERADLVLEFLLMMRDYRGGPKKHAVHVHWMTKVGLDWGRIVIWAKSVTYRVTRIRMVLESL